MSNKHEFKVGDIVVRTRAIDTFKYGGQPLEVIGFDPVGDLKFKQDNPDSWGWVKSCFELYKPSEPEVKLQEQPTPDRKLRLTEMQKEAIQAGITALYFREESLKEQSYNPSLTYHIEICKYQQEVLRSILREVNR